MSICGNSDISAAKFGSRGLPHCIQSSNRFWLDMCFNNTIQPSEHNVFLKHLIIDTSWLIFGMMICYFKQVLRVINSIVFKVQNLFCFVKRLQNIVYHPQLSMIR